MSYAIRVPTTRLRRYLSTISSGVLAGAVVALLWPSVRALSTRLECAFLAKYPTWVLFPSNLGVLAVVILVCAIVLLSPPTLRLVRRLWASWRVGFSPGLSFLWFGCSAIFLCLLDAGYLRSFWIPLCLAFLLTGFHIWRVERVRVIPRKTDSTLSASYLDLPITKWDDDKLHRQLIVESLAAQISEECAPIIALTAPYGDGKTSVLNLLESSLKLNEGVRVVRYSSWLPGSEEVLVATLFNSIVRTLQDDFLLGRARTDFIRYARSIATVIPSAGKVFREWFREPAQSEQIAELKRIIREFPVRVVVLVDDVDRMHKEELQALLKLIRGISDFSNITYVCAFHEGALKKAMRPLMDEGDASEYLQKFFPVQYPLPPIDSFVLASEFDKRFEQLCKTNHLLENEDERTKFNDTFSPLWQTHVKLHLANLRKIQLFFNRISSSIAPIAGEVDVLDYFLLELIRDCAPALYLEIYRNGRFFYYSDWRTQTWLESLGFDKARARARRKEFFDEFITGIPSGKQDFLITILEALFPAFKDYRNARGFNTASPDPDRSEKQKKIYHPDFFPSYFIGRVPSTQFSEAEFAEFFQQVNAQNAVLEVAVVFKKTFELCQPPPKRWYFLRKVSANIGKFDEIRARGIALGIAQAANDVQPDDVFSLGEWSQARAIVFLVAQRLADRAVVTEFLLSILDNSSSDEFSAQILFYCTNRDRNNVLTEWGNVDLDKLRQRFRQILKARFPAGSATALFASGEKRTLSILFGWFNAGDEGTAEVSDYLRTEVEINPALLGKMALWFFPAEAIGPDNSPALWKLLKPTVVREILARVGDRVTSSGEEEAAVVRMRTALPAD